LSATQPPGDTQAAQQFSPASPGGHPGTPAAPATAASAAQLEALLAETAAYRAFFRQAGKDTLMIP